MDIPKKERLLYLCCCVFTTENIDMVSFNNNSPFFLQMKAIFSEHDLSCHLPPSTIAPQLTPPLSGDFPSQFMNDDVTRSLHCQSPSFSWSLKPIQNDFDEYTYLALKKKRHNRNVRTNSILR